MTVFYGSPFAHNKNNSCNKLQHLVTNNDLSWLVCGDINEIMYSFEKKEGLPRDEKRMELFRGTLEECRLIDVGYYG